MKRKLTPAEERAYADLAEAARRLREAQRAAERRAKRRTAHRRILRTYNRTVQVRGYPKTFGSGNDVCDGLQKV